MENADAALEFFAQWQLGRATVNRLREARSVLQDVVCKNSFGDSGPDKFETAKAIQTVDDFFQIASVLGPTRVDGIAGELAPAFAGALREIDRSAAPYETQSQFWLATIFARAGIVPMLLAAEVGHRPDYVVSVDTIYYAIEVKRPHSWHSAPDALDRAAAQIRSVELPGAVILDVSACVGADRLLSQTADGSPWMPRDIENEIEDNAQQLFRRAMTYRRSNKYDRVALVLLFARIGTWAHWARHGLNWALFLNGQNFSSACAGLIATNTIRLREALVRGFRTYSDVPGTLRIRNRWL